MPRTTSTITKSIKLRPDASLYWIFESIDFPDSNYPEAWKAVSRFCRWYVSDHGYSNDLRDIYGILQLTKPLSRSVLKKYISHNIPIELIPATLSTQACFLPPSQDYDEFIVHEYGEQKIPKINTYEYSSPKETKFSTIAVNLGMDPEKANDKDKVVQFFRDRKKTSRKPRVKPLTQSLGDIPASDSHSDTDVIIEEEDYVPLGL